MGFWSQQISKVRRRRAGFLPPPPTHTHTHTHTQGVTAFRLSSMFNGDRTAFLISFTLNTVRYGNSRLIEDDARILNG